MIIADMEALAVSADQAAAEAQRSGQLAEARCWSNIEQAAREIMALRERDRKAKER